MIAPAPQADVLHLVSAPAGKRDHRPPVGRLIPTYLCAQAIQQGLTPPGRVLLIGDPDSESFARALGLRIHRRLTPPLGQVSMLSRTVRRLARSASRVICWNDELSPLLRGLHPPTDLISTNPNLAPRRVSSKVSIRVFERHDRGIWESRNHSAELDSVLTPLIDNPPSLVPGPDRESLGITQSDLCIGVIADRPSDIDARAFGFLLGLLNASGFALTGVISSGASHLMDARRHHRGLESRFRLLVAREPIITMLPLFDVLLHPCYDGSGGASLIERLCENADTPVLRLRHSGRDGLSRAPGVAGPIIEALDEILEARTPMTKRNEVEIHA